MGFIGIRKRPVIRLQAILVSLFAMPLFGMRSLLSNDREAGTVRCKGLFGCRRKMVASDSTFARVLKWLNPEKGNQRRLVLKEFRARLTGIQDQTPPQGLLGKAISYTLGQYEANGHEPYWYLRFLFNEMIRANTKDQLAALLPQNVGSKASRYPSR